MFSDNCNRCPYSQEITNGMIELNKKPSSICYCRLEFPIECQQGRLPRELQERESYNND